MRNNIHVISCLSFVWATGLIFLFCSHKASCSAAATPVSASSTSDSSSNQNFITALEKIIDTTSMSCTELKTAYSALSEKVAGKTFVSIIQPLDDTPHAHALHCGTIHTTRPHYNKAAINMQNSHGETALHMLFKQLIAGVREGLITTSVLYAVSSKLDEIAQLKASAGLSQLALAEALIKRKQELNPSLEDNEGNTLASLVNQFRQHLTAATSDFPCANYTMNIASWCLYRRFINICDSIKPE